MFANKCMKIQVCKDCTYRQNRVSEVLTDVRLSIYFSLRSWIRCRIIWLEYSEVCYLLCLDMQKNLLNIFIVWYHKDLIICFLVQNHFKFFTCNFFKKIGIHAMQCWTATMRHGVTRKRSSKRLKHTQNLFRKNLQSKDVIDNIDILVTSRNGDRKVM